MVSRGILNMLIDSFLLGLPNDVLVALLIRLPPRSLLVLSRTCRVLNEQLKNEAVWRGSYLNRYLWEGAASVDWVKEEVRVLAQGCTNEGQRGWKKESVSREAMLEWVSTNSMMLNRMRRLISS